MSGSGWIDYLIRFWFWMRVASDRQEYNLMRWITSLFFVIMLLTPFAFQAQGYHSWILWPILLIGLGGVAYKLQQLSDRIWNYSGQKKRAAYEKPNLGPDAYDNRVGSFFGLR